MEHDCAGEGAHIDRWSVPAQATTVRVAWRGSQHRPGIPTTNGATAMHLLHTNAPRRRLRQLRGNGRCIRPIGASLGRDGPRVARERVGALIHGPSVARTSQASVQQQAPADGAKLSSACHHSRCRTRWRAGSSDATTTRTLPRCVARLDTPRCALWAVGTCVLHTNTSGSVNATGSRE